MIGKDTVFWSGRTEKDRIPALQEIEHCISDFGYMEDFHLFSDLAIGISIAAAENRINNLYDALAQYLHMEAFERVTSYSERERKIMLHIDFSSGTGNLRTEVPDVPG